MIPVRPYYQLYWTTCFIKYLIYWTILQIMQVNTFRNTEDYETKGL